MFNNINLKIMQKSSCGIRAVFVFIFFSGPVCYGNYYDKIQSDKTVQN